jgi:hypothetical protein
MQRGINGKSIIWKNFHKVSESDYDYLVEEYDLATEVIDLVRAGIVISEPEKVGIFTLFSVPVGVWEKKTDSISIEQLYFLISKKTVITISSKNIESVQRYFERVTRSVNLRNEILSFGEGRFVGRMLDYICREQSIWTKHFRNIFIDKTILSKGKYSRFMFDVRVNINQLSALVESQIDTIQKVRDEFTPKNKIVDDFFVVENRLRSNEIELLNMIELADIYSREMEVVLQYDFFNYLKKWLRSSVYFILLLIILIILNVYDFENVSRNFLDALTGLTVFGILLMTFKLIK